MPIEPTVPIINRQFVGEIYLDDKGRLVCGDTDVVRECWANYAGARQLGIVTITFQLIPMAQVGVSPSANGMFAERSEPR